MVAVVIVSFLWATFQLQVHPQPFRLPVLCFIVLGLSILSYDRLEMFIFTLLLYAECNPGISSLLTLSPSARV